MFERHGIGYVAEGGTAIGAERHSGIIPWDDDFDLAVHEDYEDVLLNAVADDLCKWNRKVLGEQNCQYWYLTLEVFFVSVTNYSVTWRKDESSDYKFYHTENSIVIPRYKEEKNWWRYPFADIFLYEYKQDENIYSYKNGWKDLKQGPGGQPLGKFGFNASAKWPNNTMLTKFGYYKMRVSIDNSKYIERLFGSNWHDVGVTPWYNHYKDVAPNTIAFEIPFSLYRPGMPYN